MPGPSPSPWVVRHAGLVPAGGEVLDVAAGNGRHTRYFLERGHPVTAVDLDVGGLPEHESLTVVAADLEHGRPPPFAGQEFAGVVVTNYLHRPLLPWLIDAVGPGGAFIYETFAVGNERFGRPTNPDFLLREGELLEMVAGRLAVIAYEHVTVGEPRPAVVQRVGAVNNR